MSLTILDVEKLVEQLKRHEGQKVVRGRHIPYQDSLGIWTAGYGHNLGIQGGISVPSPGFSQKIVDLLLAEDIAEHMAVLYVKIPWVHNIDGVRQAVLVNMAFNLGVGNEKKGLLSFTNTLLLVEHGDYVSAAENMLKSKWAKQVGNRAIELAKMMETGRWDEDS